MDGIVSRSVAPEVSESKPVLFANVFLMVSNRFNSARNLVSDTSRCIAGDLTS